MSNEQMEINEFIKFCIGPLHKDLPTLINLAFSFD